VTRFTQPAALDETHAMADFRSGTEALDSWLHRRALRNQASGASRTFVTCPIGNLGVVAGFYSLAASSVALDQAPGSVRRNMPNPIPVILLGRLAVDLRHQNAGLGTSLLQDAVRRVAGVADTVGVRALLVHAIDEDAAAFYGHFGFVASNLDAETLFLSMHSLRASLRAGA
jgi:GNAT superfamily N-acetyltransferase